MTEWFVGGHTGLLQSLDVNSDQKVSSCSPSLLAVRTLHKEQLFPLSHLSLRPLVKEWGKISTMNTARQERAEGKGLVPPAAPRRAHPSPFLAGGES